MRPQLSPPPRGALLRGGRAVALLLALSGQAAAQHELQLLLNFGSDHSSRPKAVTPDLAFLAGEGSNGTFPHALRWTAAGQPALLQPLHPLYATTAQGITDDGRVVVGDSGSNAVMWSGVNPPVVLPPLAGDSDSFATGVSGDGAVIVGSSHLPPFEARACSWDAMGNVSPVAAALPLERTRCVDVSRDGNVVVGWGYSFATEPVAHAFRVDGGVVCELAPLPGGERTLVTAVSSNGRYAVGEADDGGATWPVLWDSTRLPLRLGTLATATRVTPYAVSDDGRTVVGQAILPMQGFSLSVAFYWSPATGVVRLQEYAEALGIEGLGAVRLLAAADDLTPDGSRIVGTSARGSWPPFLVEELFVLDLSEFGVRFCDPSHPGSQASGAVLAARGSTAHAGGTFELQARLLPPTTPVLFLNSRQVTQSFTLPGSAGRLCLGRPIGRFGAGAVQLSTPGGTAMITVDPTALPRPGGSVAIQPGETWAFQAWYRDPTAAASSDFTSGIAVTFD